MDETADVIIVGAGIVGLAVARAVLHAFPRCRLLVLEKERAIGRHQTLHNSGVVHSGVYYRPGSLKARLCVRGRAELLAYARARGIPHRVLGKLIVATRPSEGEGLREIERHGRANGVEGLRRLSSEEIRAVEPDVRGREALMIPSAAIIDYSSVAASFAQDVAEAGGAVVTNARVTRITEGRDRVTIRCAGTGSEYVTRQLVGCAGLYADMLARAGGAVTSDRIIPFRGEYHTLPRARAHLVDHLVYPVPDPRLPFLCVHLTPTVDGRLLAGPNALLAFAREGYRLTRVRWGELAQTLTFPGFWRMLGRVPHAVVGELYRSLSVDEVARDLARMVPALRSEKLAPAEAGVRAQAVGPDGSLRDDFVFAGTPRQLHVINAPSPAATASLAIADEIVARLPPLPGR